jgi:hypothetical protein
MSRAFPLIAAILIVLLIGGSPVQAAPVRFTEVIQVINGLQNPADLRLNHNTHAESTVPAGIYDQTQSGAKGTDSSTSKGDASLLTGVAMAAPDAQQGAVVVVAQGEVDGTVCDCGEIWVPGGFPKWPLVFLAGIPLIFINGDEDLPPLPPSTPEEPRSEPTPTPTPPPSVPEPGSLLLLGTGLAAFGAGLRRRYNKSRLAAQSQTTEEG